MPKNLLNEEEITLEKLRKQFEAEDFTKLDIKPYSEYTPQEIELHNKIRTYVDEHWKELLKDFGIKNQKSCYAKDYPPEYLREYMERLIADSVIGLFDHEANFQTVWEEIVVPILEQENSDELADKYLDNMVCTLLKTVDIKGITEASKECSTDEDFNKKKYINYPKIDHDRKWNHTRSKIKTKSLDELLENYEEVETQVQFDPELATINNVTLREIIDNADEQEKQILSMLAQGLNQSEIASRLGITQGTVSKKIGKIRKQYKTD